MQFAQVVFGLPVDGPFDYAVPEYMRAAIRPGCRVEVFFGRRRAIGYVVGLAGSSRVRAVKNVVRLIDEYPLLGARMLALTRRLSLRYCCSWGEMIETALPVKLRRGMRIDVGEIPADVAADAAADGPLAVPLVVQDLQAGKRWELYIKEISAALGAGKRALVLVPDERSLGAAVQQLRRALGREPAVLARSSPAEVQTWAAVRSGAADVVAGLRSAIFAPVPALGVIIVDDEHDDAYKQDQVPHYHAREAALMRARSEQARIVFGAALPSAELVLLARQKKAACVRIERAGPYPQIRMLSARTEFQRRQRPRAVLNKFFEDAIAEELSRKGKVLIFLNRTGFATWAACNNCGAAVKCPRCAVSLVLHYAQNVLSCHSCPYSAEPPKVCPECNAGYIKYSGIGLEKLESEIARLYPQARVGVLDSAHHDVPRETDILLASRSVFTRPTGTFDLVVVLGIDNALNKAEFRAAEHVAAQLAGLLTLAEKRLYIQTGLSHHPVFQSLSAGDFSAFYDHELAARRELGLPPYRHLVQVKVRAVKEEKAKAAAESLFASLGAAVTKKITIVSLAPGRPARLRGKYYWQILLSCVDAEKGGAFVKRHLSTFRHSGVTVTVDVDPV